MTELRAAALDPADLVGLADVLAAAGLPLSDLAEPGRLFLRFNDGALAGFGGMEGDGPDRLLRSLVVVPNRRGAGLGRTMLGLLETYARELCVARLHLLTNTAAPFFAANGHAAADRTTAPAPIVASREFAALCPACTAYLIKAL